MKLVSKPYQDKNGEKGKYKKRKEILSHLYSRPIISKWPKVKNKSKQKLIQKGTLTFCSS